VAQHIVPGVLRLFFARKSLRGQIECEKIDKTVLRFVYKMPDTSSTVPKLTRQ
jgi:hypothetical protein